MYPRVIGFVFGMNGLALLERPLVVETGHSNAMRAISLLLVCQKKGRGAVLAEWGMGGSTRGMLKLKIPIPSIPSRKAAALAIHAAAKDRGL